MMKWLFIPAIAAVVVILLLPPIVSAQATPPQFPVCSEAMQAGDGDWAHADAGEHSVPGQSAPVRGSQNIYYRGSGNFVQCVCPEQGAGTQVWWWNISDVAENAVNEFSQQGWQRVNGADYGLMHYPYLVNVGSYSCNAASNVTGSPTPSVTSPTPTTRISGSPTPTVRPTTPTPTGNQECRDIKPVAPTILSITKSGTDSAELVWSVPTGGADNYAITYGKRANKQAETVEKTGKTTSYRVSDLDLRETYFFKVRATRGCAVSEWSSEFQYPKDAASLNSETKGGLADTASFGQIFGMLSVAVSAIGVIGYGMKQASTKKPIIR